MLLTVKEHCASLLGTLLFSLQQQAILVQRCSHRLTEKSGSFLMSCLPHLSFICGWCRLCHHSVALHVCGTLTTDPSGTCKFEFLLQCLQKWQILVIFLFSVQVLNYINQTHRSWLMWRPHDVWRPLIGSWTWLASYHSNSETSQRSLWGWDWRS